MTSVSRRTILTVSRAVLAAMPVTASARQVARAPVEQSPVSPAIAFLHRARVARLAQDSAIRSYVAVGRQRITLSGILREGSRERLLFRRERAARIEWRLTGGATVTMLGVRSAAIVPSFAREELSENLSDNVAPPYFPGQEPLWVGGEKAASAVDKGRMRHPLAAGGERYHRYALGDSITLRLPDGTTIPLRELRITAREPRPDVIVGSFWFDVRTARLVRAAYRVAAPQHIFELELERDPASFDDIPPPLRSLLRTLTVHIEGITVEYGLVEQRFWLPRVRVLEATARVAVGTFPLRMEDVFRYETVNAEPSTTSAEAVTAPPVGYHQSARYVIGGGPEVRVWMPDDTASLRVSPELPGSVFDDADDGFTAAVHHAVQRALGPSVQAAFAPQPPRIRSGLPLARFNRIEGLSLGAAARWTLGRGLELDATARLGVARDHAVVERRALLYRVVRRS